MVSSRPFPLSRVSLLLPWLILVVTLSVTWLLWDHECNASRKEVKAQFDFALRDTVGRIEQRVAAYEQMMRGFQSLFSTTELSNREAIRHYVESLQLDANFSGVGVLGVAELVPAEGKRAHELAMRQRGLRDYSIHPAGQRDYYAPIIQRAPEGARGNIRLGLDPWADPVRRLAMESARNSGMAAITAKVRLAIDTSLESRPGFIMYLPIYAHGQPRDSVAQRRASLIGWIYAPFFMDDFMASLYGSAPAETVLTIYDDADPVADALMYRSGPLPADLGDAPMRANEYMVVAGRTWTVNLQTLPEFEARYGRDAATIIAVTGVGLSISLALLAWFMVTGRARALRLAAGMTEELRHMAQHDPLTGLPNRALFSDRLENELARARRQGGHFALIFLDLDRFKPINDNYGHAVGDRLLQQVARRLKDVVRASDTVGRIGGDEFVVLMPMIAEAEAASVLAEKLRQVIARPFKLDGRDLTISCSLGVALYPDDGTDEIMLTNRADEAMYRAKESGRDAVCLAS